MRGRAIWALRQCLAGPGGSCTPISLGPTTGTLLPKIAGLDWPRHASTTSDQDQLSILRSLHGAEFQHQLDQLRRQSAFLTYPGFLAEFRRTVPAASEEDAARVTDALAASGSILRHGPLVYLRPTEIAAALRRVLPLDVDAVRARLADVEAELSGLEAQRSAIVTRARRRTKALNYTFFAAVAAQWAALFRLTYWELSWDVIEPIGFFVGGINSMASIAWFLWTRQDFTFESMHQRFMSTYERKAFQESGFDIVDYNRLTHERTNLLELLEAHEEAAAAARASARGATPPAGDPAAAA